MDACEIIITADDLGISAGVNDGILEAFERGVVTTCSLLANGLALEHAANDTLARSETLPVGVHLNIMFGRPLRMDHPRLVGPDGLFRGSYAGVLRHCRSGRNRDLFDAIRDEFRAQAEVVANATARPVDHFNTQSHVHAIPALFDLVSEVAAESGCSGVRRYRERPVLPFVNRNVGPGDSARALLLSMLSRGITTDAPGVPRRICGMNRSGTVYEDVITAFVSRRPPGLSEICVHPGHPLTGAGLYTQRWVDAWIESPNRRTELDAVTTWSKQEFEARFGAKLRAFSETGS